jgi:hypothetical protein
MGVYVVSLGRNPGRKTQVFQVLKVFKICTIQQSTKRTKCPEFNDFNTGPFLFGLAALLENSKKTKT